MATLSGKTGVASFNSGLILRVTGWSVNERVLVDRFATNQTNGYKVGVPGTKDFTGSIRAKYDASIVPTAGQSANVALIVKTSSPSIIFSSTAVIESVELEVDVDDGAPVAYVLTISGNGAELVESVS